MNRSKAQVVSFASTGFRAALLALCIAGCSDDDDATDDDGGDTECTLTEYTESTGVGDEDCPVLERDTTSCQEDRVRAGLTGYWLKFSCRVDLSMDDDGNIIIATDSQPDYKSVYFDDEDACYEAWPDGSPNPNEIGVKDITMTIPGPAAVSGDGETLGGGAIGVALNGVVLFSNGAAPPDTIYDEVETMDKCNAHPTPSPDSTYHYHTEPYSISYDDANFIGVMRDGNPVYGRKDSDGTVPSEIAEEDGGLDDDGGHTGVTDDSEGKEIYHYHVNEQTGNNSEGDEVSVWFISKGVSHNDLGDCDGCSDM